MKKLISILIAVIMVISVCTVSAFAEDVYEGDFYIEVTGGSRKVTIDWDEFYGASMYRVSIDTEVEFFCVDEIVKDTSYNWVPDASVTPDTVFDITVYAYDDNGALLAQSNVVQATVVVYLCDYMGYYGDVDGDENVTVMDATLIQRYLAQAHDFDLMKQQMADVDADGTVSVMDSTYVQQFVASIYKDENRTNQWTMIGWAEYNVNFDKWWEA